MPCFLIVDPAYNILVILFKFALRYEILLAGIELFDKLVVNNVDILEEFLSFAKQFVELVRGTDEFTKGSVTILMLFVAIFALI